MSKKVESSVSRREAIKVAIGAILVPNLSRAQFVDAGPNVETAYGRVRGVSKGPVKVFLGIPYGAPTNGDNRWTAPKQPAPWTGTLDASRLGPRCPQIPEDLIPEVAEGSANEPMSEDCLRLNVWTQATGIRRRPVMVWFHGGGYQTGSGGNRRYDGTNLAAKRDVVVVTVNHRLNAFGYLYLAEIGGPRYVDSGALGILDLIAALGWVRDNIAQFGGDPSNVTIFGESGGGGKVTTLMASPQAHGLFHKAIAQSGIAMRHITPEAASRTARAFMDRVGLAPNQVDKLTTMPLENILKGITPETLRAFAPVVDGRTIPSDPFDPVAPRISADVPLILGSNLTETTFMKSTPLDSIDDGSLLKLVQQNLRVDKKQATEVITIFRHANPGASNQIIYQLVSSDNWLTINVARAAERRAALGGAPTFVYHFRKATPVRDGKLNVPHTLDIPYVFDNIALSTAITGDGPDKYALAEQLSSAWTNFAKTGTPTAEGWPAWPSYTPDRRQVLVINDRSEVISDPRRAERLAIAALTPEI